MAIGKALNTPEIPTGYDGNVEVDLDYGAPTTNGSVTVTDLPDGGAEVDFDPSRMEAQPDIPFYDNMADYIDEDDLTRIASKLIGLVEQDDKSRSDWKNTYTAGLDLLGIKVEERTEPWDGACGINHPLLAEAVVRFQSQEVGEMFPAAGPVRVKLLGKETPVLVKQANRVKNYMNYLETEVMREFREEVDKLLFTLPLAGSAFKKTYWDATLGRPVSDYVPPEDLIVASNTKSLVTCRRITHVNRVDANEVRKYQAAGVYRQVDLRPTTVENSVVKDKKDELTGVETDYTDDTIVTLYEIHTDLEIPGFEDAVDGVITGIHLPYVVTIDKMNMKVLSIRRNWIEEDQNKVKREHFTHWQYIPGLGFYGLGLIHLIGGIAKGSTSILRQLVDAGTLSNLPGGYKSRGLRVTGNNTPVAAGEWRDVDIPAGKISDHIFPLPYGEPSQVLAALLGSIVEEGRRFASLTDVNISSMNNEAPVGTTLALLERNLKVMTAISARGHASQHNELRILVSIVKDNYDEYPYEVDDPQASIKSDFDDRIDVIPVSDPNSSTMAQRIMTYQTALQLAQQAPGAYPGIKVLHRRMLSALEIPDVEEIIPLAEDVNLLDPVSENMNILNGIPVKAFPEQDHQSHIQAHMLAIQDPKMQQLLEQSPTAGQGFAAAMSHVTEHLAFEYRNEVERELGTQLPPPGEPLPAEVENRLSGLIARAAERLFNRNSAEIAMMENQEKLQDPVIMNQTAEIGIKALEAETRRMKADRDAQISVAKLFQKDATEEADREARLVSDAERIRAQLIGDMLEAASRTEAIQAGERSEIVNFILSRIQSESDGVRQELQNRADSGDANMKMLIDLLNSKFEMEDE